MGNKKRNWFIPDMFTNEFQLDDEKYFHKYRHLVSHALNYDKNRIKPSMVQFLCAALQKNAYRETPFLYYVALAKELGAWQAISSCCPFCKCIKCCQCARVDYSMRDPERVRGRRGDMRAFDRRVPRDMVSMQIMYNRDLDMPC